MHKAVQDVQYLKVRHADKLRFLVEEAKETFNESLKKGAEIKVLESVLETLKASE